VPLPVTVPEIVEVPAAAGLAPFADGPVLDLAIRWQKCHAGVPVLPFLHGP